MVAAVHRGEGRIPGHGHLGEHNLSQQWIRFHSYRYAVSVTIRVGGDSAARQEAVNFVQSLRIESAVK